MIQSYKRKFKTLESYDTIVIGSGIGGLVAASHLAAKGARILVLENYVIGVLRGANENQFI